MAQRIHVARCPEDEGLAAELGVRCPASGDAPARLILWWADDAPAGAAAVRLTGSVARIGPVVSGRAGEHRVGGLVAMLKTAMRAACVLADGVPDRFEVQADGIAGVLAGLGFSHQGEGLFAACRGSLSASFVESPEGGMLGEAAERRIYARGEQIFSKGDDADRLAVVERGSVRLIGVDRRGLSAEVGLLGPGSLLGEEALGSVAYCGTHALAHAAEVDVITLDRDGLAQRLAAEPAANAWLQSMLVRRIRSLTGRVLDGEDPAVTARVARVLAAYGQRAARMGLPGTPACHLRWLAEQVGVTPLRARSMLTDVWEHCSLLREEVRIHDAEALGRLADSLDGGPLPDMMPMAAVG